LFVVDDIPALLVAAITAMQRLNRALHAVPIPATPPRVYPQHIIIPETPPNTPDTLPPASQPIAIPLARRALWRSCQYCLRVAIVQPAFCDCAICCFLLCGVCAHMPTFSCPGLCSP